jgi:hypothetical protein
VLFTLPFYVSVGSDLFRVSGLVLTFVWFLLCRVLIKILLVLPSVSCLQNSVSAPGFPHRWSLFILSICTRSHWSSLFVSKGVLKCWYLPGAVRSVCLGFCRLIFFVAVASSPSDDFPCLPFLRLFGPARLSLAGSCFRVGGRARGFISGWLRLSAC